jgi:hypothetical protein
MLSLTVVVGNDLAMTHLFDPKGEDHVRDNYRNLDPIVAARLCWTGFFPAGRQPCPCVTGDCPHPDRSPANTIDNWKELSHEKMQ